MGSRVVKEERIAFRLSAQLKRQLDEAVAMTGRSQTDLITEAISEKTSALIREQHLLELSERDMDALVAALENPSPPNDAMKRSIARWRAYGSPQ